MKIEREEWHKGKKSNTWLESILTSQLRRESRVMLDMTYGSSSDTTMNMQEEKEIKKIDKPGFSNQSRGFFDKSEGSVFSPPLPLEYQKVTRQIKKDENN